MSKKIIDWDELRAELLSDSEVQASFDAEERKERLREMLAQWRNHAGLTRAQVAETPVTARTSKRLASSLAELT